MKTWRPQVREKSIFCYLLDQKVFIRSRVNVYWLWTYYNNVYLDWWANCFKSLCRKLSKRHTGRMFVWTWIMWGNLQCNCGEIASLASQTSSWLSAAGAVRLPWPITASHQWTFEHKHLRNSFSKPLLSLWCWDGRINTGFLREMLTDVFRVRPLR